LAAIVKDNFPVSQEQGESYLPAGSVADDSQREGPGRHYPSADWRSGSAIGWPQPHFLQFAPNPSTRTTRAAWPRSPDRKERRPHEAGSRAPRGPQALMLWPEMEPSCAKALLPSAEWPKCGFGHV